VKKTVNFAKGIKMNVKIGIIILLFTTGLFHNGFAQTKNTPTVIVKNEFCPPAEYANDGETMQEGFLTVVNEPFLKKAAISLSYNEVYKKLNRDFTVTKWKFQNIHNEQQVDTLIIITRLRQSDRLVYYKLNKSAGKSSPALMNATLSSDIFSVAGMKMGNTTTTVKQKIAAPKNDMRDDTIIYVTDKTGNSYLNLSFIQSGDKFILTFIGYSGYWD
jgi:hypothetical protein